MTYFSPSRTRARARLFDAHISATSDALSDQNVAERLGAVAGSILRVCETAFLPDVNHGVARLPVNEAGSNNVAYLPLLRSDGPMSGMRISKALAAPSIVTDIVCRGETGVGLIDAYESLFPEEPLKIGGRKVGGMTTTQRFTVEKNGQKRLYAGRSIVTLAKFNHPGGYAPNVAHEFLHAIDAQRRGINPMFINDGPERMQELAAREFRAYRVTSLLLEACGAEDPCANGMMSLWDEFNIGESNGWDVPEAAIEKAEKLGVL